MTSQQECFPQVCVCVCQVVTDSLGNAILGNRTSAIKSIEEMARLRVNISLLGTANTKACVCVCVCVCTAPGARG